MRNRNTIYRRIAAALCVALLCCALSACSNQNSLGTVPSPTDPPTIPAPTDNSPVSISWDMYGTYVTPQGGFNHRMAFSVSAQIQADMETRDYLDIQFSFPDSFRYTHMNSTDPHTSSSRQYFNFPYYVVPSYTCYDTLADTSSTFSYALSLEKGYMMIVWKDNGLYLVASRDQETPYEDILAYFQGFVDKYVDPQ